MSGAIHATNTPEFLGVYVTIAPDVAGLTTQNNVITMFNPTGSGRLHIALSLSVSAYAIGASGTATSFTGRRISAFTGGTVATQANIDRFITTMPDPVSQIVTANPTVTLSGSNANYVTPPPITVGTGGNISSTVVNPSSASFVLFPGQGLSFGTSAGNINQVWSIEYIWGEVKI